MTQLREEGWIHHLARHAVACFLTRGDLWLSWEEGMKVHIYDTCTWRKSRMTVSLTLCFHGDWRRVIYEDYVAVVVRRAKMFRSGRGEILSGCHRLFVLTEMLMLRSSIEIIRPVLFIKVVTVIEKFLQNPLFSSLFLYTADGVTWIFDAFKYKTYFVLQGV